MVESAGVPASMPLNEGNTTASDFATLASAQGVPLAHHKGDSQAVVLFAPPCCSLHASTNVQQHSGPVTTMYDTAEHVITVAGCQLPTPYDSLDALTAKLPVGNLTYGQIIALGGDFYGDPNKAVSDLGALSDQVNKFRSNFNSLAGAAGQEVQAILQVAQQYEFGPISQAVAKGNMPSGVYAALPTSPGHVVPDEDRAFDAATGGTAISNGRYLNLAAYNLDHFGVDAITCYLAGHWSAQYQAQEAAKNSDPVPQLLLAYAMNAFADHFLTDLFAAGHMRTPRRKLYYYGTGVSAIAAGLCAKAMHDEDNKFGLWVSNARGDSWVAYGDARYRDPANAANRQIMKLAIQQSINEVWNAYEGGHIVTTSSQVLQYLPTLITDIQDRNKAQANRDDARNWAPLFWWNPADNWMYVRNSLTDISERGYTWKYSVGLNTTAVSLQSRGTILMPPAQYGTHYPPDETGPRGQLGWPASGPGWQNLIKGQDFQNGVKWVVDGTPGPTSPL